MSHPLWSGKMREDEEVLSNCGIKAPRSKIALFLSDPVDGSSSSSKSSIQKASPSKKREKVKVELTTGGAPVVTLKVSERSRCKLREKRVTWVLNDL